MTTLPPIHLRIFVRDLGIMVKYSGDGDICQGMFEDYILHNDEKNPPMKRGHYVRKPPQMEQCVRYVDFCNARQPGSLPLTDPLFPLTRDSSRFVYNIQEYVHGVRNISLAQETLQAFWEGECAAGR
jgi:hypothetical protein